MPCSGGSGWIHFNEDTPYFQQILLMLTQTVLFGQVLFGSETICFEYVNIHYGFTTNIVYMWVQNINSTII